MVAVTLYEFQHVYEPAPGSQERRYVFRIGSMPRARIQTTRFNSFIPRSIRFKQWWLEVGEKGGQGEEEDEDEEEGEGGGAGGGAGATARSAAVEAEAATAAAGEWAGTAAAGPESAAATAAAGADAATAAAGSATAGSGPGPGSTAATAAAAGAGTATASEAAGCVEDLVGGEARGQGPAGAAGAGGGRGGPLHQRRYCRACGPSWETCCAQQRRLGEGGEGAS